MSKTNLHSLVYILLNISILKNPLLWFQVFIIAFVVFLFMLVLLVEANLFQYQWEAIPSSFVVATIIGGGFFSVISLILLVVYIQGIPTTYVLNDNTIEQYTLSKKKKTFSFLSILGIASGKSAGFSAAGAHMLARSREHMMVKWKDVSLLEDYPQRNEIRLKNQWRTVMQVACPKEQFDSILEFIKSKVKKTKQIPKVGQMQKPSFEKKVLLTLIILICGSFLFVRLPIHYVGLFTISTLIMALLVVWSVGKKKKIFAAFVTLIPIIAVVAAFVIEEVDMSRSGSVYALVIELISIFFFILLGINTLLKQINHNSSEKSYEQKK